MLSCKDFLILTNAARRKSSLKSLGGSRWGHDAARGRTRTVGSSTIVLHTEIVAKFVRNNLQESVCDVHVMQFRYQSCVRIGSEHLRNTGGSPSAVRKATNIPFANSIGAGTIVTRQYCRTYETKIVGGCISATSMGDENGCVLSNTVLLVVICKFL